MRQKPACDGYFSRVAVKKDMVCADVHNPSSTFSALSFLNEQ